jgi:hypothetical protein
MQDQRTDPGLIWIVLFLAFAFALIVTGAGWLAFGPVLR